MPIKSVLVTVVQILHILLNFCLLDISARERERGNENELKSFTSLWSSINFCFIYFKTFNLHYHLVNLYFYYIMTVFICSNVFFALKFILSFGNRYQ